MASPPTAPPAPFMRSPTAPMRLSTSPHKRVRDEELQDSPATDDSEQEVARELLHSPRMNRSSSVPSGSGLSRMGGASPSASLLGGGREAAPNLGATLGRRRNSDGKPLRKRTSVEQWTFDQAHGAGQAQTTTSTLSVPRPSSPLVSSTFPPSAMGRKSASRPLPAFHRSTTPASSPPPLPLQLVSGPLPPRPALLEPLVPARLSVPKTSTSPVAPPTASSAAFAETPISTSPVDSPPRESRRRGAGVEVKVAQAMFSRPISTPTLAEPLRTSSPGSLPGKLAAADLSAVATTATSPYLIEEQMLSASSPPRPKAAPSSPPDIDMTIEESIDNFEASTIPLVTAARKSASSRSNSTAIPSQLFARKSASQVPPRCDLPARSLGPAPAPPPPPAPVAAPITAPAMDRSPPSRDKSGRFAAVSNLAAAAASLPSPAISASPALDRPRPSRRSSTTSVADSTRSRLSKDSPVPTRAGTPRSDAVTRLRPNKKDSSSSAMAVDGNDSQWADEEVRQERTQPKEGRSGTVVAKGKGKARQSSTPVARTNGRRLAKGKGKARDQGAALLSSSDDEPEVVSGPPLPRFRKPADPRPRQPQAWEEPDPENFIATALHPKRFVVKVSSLTLLAMDGRSDLITKVKLIVKLRDAAADPSSFITSAASSHLEFRRSAVNPDTDLATFGRQPITLDLILVPSLCSSTSQLVLDFRFEWGLAVYETRLPLTSPSNRIILGHIPTHASFHGSDTRLGLQVEWSAELVGGGRALSSEESVEETCRRLRRLEIDANPTWLPDGKVQRKQRVLRMPKLSGGRRGFDQLTKHPFAPGQIIPELYDADTPTTTRVAVAKYDRDVRRTDLPPKERLIYQLHFRWCSLHPYPGLIVNREVACWTHFASTVHHFDARLELAGYLHSQLVVRDAHAPLARVEMRREGKPEEEIQKVKWTGLLSVADWQTVMSAFDGAVASIGPGESYEELRSAAGC